jgi:hypothetical protein
MLAVGDRSKSPEIDLRYTCEGVTGTRVWFYVDRLPEVAVGT